MNNSGNSQERLYPMLESCRIAVVRPQRSSTTSKPNRPPVRLPQECIDAYQEIMQQQENSSSASTGSNIQVIPKLYDFALERDIIRKKQERDIELDLYRSDSRDELQENIVSRMQSATNASEDVCISLLQSKSFDLRTSVEAFLSSTSTSASKTIK